MNVSPDASAQPGRVPRGVNLAVDLGGTNLRMGLVDDSIDLLARSRVPSAGLGGRDDPLGAMIEALRTFVSGHDQIVQQAPIRSISLGVPSTVDKDRRVILSTTNIPGWTNLPAAERLEEEFGVPVFLERDTNFLVTYDLWANHVQDQPAVLGVYVGTGLGNAVVLNGGIYTGAHGVSGELGHIPLQGSTTPCGCGLVGCIEPHASGNALRRLQVERFPHTPLEDLFTEHGDHDCVTGFLEHLALAIATEVNIIDPNTVVLGGGVVAMRDFPRRALEQAVLRRVRRPLPADDLTFVYSDNSQFNGLLGGTIQALTLLGIIERNAA